MARVGIRLLCLGPSIGPTPTAVLGSGVYLADWFRRLPGHRGDDCR